VRIGVRNLLLLLAGYAALIAAFAIGIDRWLHSFEETVVLETSRLIAQEKAGLLADRSLSALEMPDGRSRDGLRQRIQDLTLLSEIVSSISVVDRDGRVVASDRWPAGHPMLPAQAIFGDGWDVRPRPGGSGRFLQGGDYALDVPLVEKGLVGYVDVEFQSRRVAGLFSSARRQLITAALCGLAGVVLLGAALQFQISRQATAIARTLEDAMQGTSLPEGPSSRDEFARALRAATGVRRALSEARRETSRLHEGFAALGQAMKMGVVLLRGDREPDFANRRALELFGAATLEELRGRWPAFVGRLGPFLARLGPTPEPAQPAEVEAPGAGVAKLRVEAYRLGGSDCDEYLLLMNDPEVLDALELDVRLANQLQGLARAYRTMAHELRAPLSAMMIHLDLLRESIATGAGSVGKESQERYVVVLREELQRLNRSLSEVLTGSLPPTERRDKFDLRDALAEVGILLAPQCRRQGVELQSRAPGTPVLLVGYRDRLKQSFLNVAVNALEAMPGGGRLQFELEVQEAEAIVRIADTGRGIPQDLLEQIYERDFTTKAGGSGIGLFVARAQVELHGGSIRVESEEGRGTRVEVRLPLVARE
jgi:signal transduction histidine kinase